MNAEIQDNEQPVDAEGHLAWRVTGEEAGGRIDRVLGRLLSPEYSRSYLSALIEEGLVTVDEGRVRPSFRLPAGARVVGELGAPASSLPGPEPMDLTILHEDDELIVVDKPVGIVIHPGSGARDGTLVNGLLHRYPELSTVGQADRPGIVHRLDRETSGVMVVARTNDAARSVVNQFKAKTVKKEYAAVVWGEMPFDSDWIDLPVGLHPKKPHLRRVDRGELGKASSTYYEVRERLGVATHVAAFPRTGRTHQIRVHLDHIGFSIVGDPQYGVQAQAAYARWKHKQEEAGRPVPGLARQALHAHAITLRHPRTDEEVTFRSSIPDDMAELIDRLRDAAPER